jgi:hypothetical protein
VSLGEGEFKAAMLWQMIGTGYVPEALTPELVASGFEPMGVAAFPGIWFGKHYECREVLEDWLLQVKCRKFIVVYDNEEKGDPHLKQTFKADRRKRFDAIKCARYLAANVALKLGIGGEVGMLPVALRDENGKVDWNNALLKVLLGNKF